MSYKRHTLETKKQALQLYESGVYCKEIGQQLGVDPSTVWKWVSEAGLIKNPEQHWSPEEIQILRELWPMADKKTLLERIPQRTWRSLTFTASSLGIRRDIYFDSIRKCIMNFSEIDTEEKAYILGFSAADGSVSKPTNRGAQKLKIALAETDLPHLKKLRDLLCPQAEIHIYERKKLSHQRLCELHINDTALCRTLTGHGIVPKKAKIVGPPPTLPEHLIHHYVRGLYDGDGSISIINRNRCTCNISGSENMLTFVNEAFRRVYSHQCKVCKGHGCHVIAYGGLSGIAFLLWIYKDATIYLKRKYQKAFSFLQEEYGSTSVCVSCKSKSNLSQYPLISEQVDPEGRFSLTLCRDCKDCVSDKDYHQLLTSYSKLNRMSQGIRASGDNLPYGYNVDSENSKLIPNEEEQLIVSHIMDLHKVGKNNNIIAQELNVSGCRTRMGSNWDRSQIRTIINRIKLISDLNGREP